MPVSYTNELFNTELISASNCDTTLGGFSNRYGDYFVFSGNHDIYGGDMGDTMHLYAGNDTVHLGPANSVYNEVFAGSGQDTIFGGSGNDYIHAGSGWDIMSGGTGTNFFDFSTAQTGTGSLFGRHDGLPGDDHLADVITDFSYGSDANTADFILADQSVVDRGMLTINSSSTNSIEQAQALAISRDAGHDYGSIWVHNQVTGNAYLLMDTGDNHTFQSGVSMPGAAWHVTPDAAHGMLFSGHG